LLRRLSSHRTQVLLHDEVKSLHDTLARERRAAFAAKTSAALVKPFLLLRSVVRSLN
jgi:hypothetical protein